MNTAPRHPCKSAGCSALLEAGQGSYCPAHRTVGRGMARARDIRRGTAAARGYGADWRPLRHDYLSRFPLCMGVLIPTEHYTQELAIEFHALREAEQAKGKLLLGPIPRPGASGPPAYSLPATRYPLLDWLSANPIYRLEPWDVGHGATVVDHIVPHRGNDLLRLASWNLQGLTKRAHDKKTATEDHQR